MARKGNVLLARFARLGVSAVIWGSLLGCGFWPGKNVQSESEARQLQGRTIRLRQNRVVVHEINDAVIEYPYVRGIETSPEGPRQVELDLRRYDAQIDYYDPGRGAIKTTGVRSESQAVRLRGKTIRLRQNEVVVHEIHDAVIEYPHVRGIEVSPEGPRQVELDLREYGDHIDYYDSTRGALMTTAGVLGVAALTAGGVLIVGGIVVSNAVK